MLVWSAEILPLGEHIFELWAFTVKPDLAYGLKEQVSIELISFIQSYAKRCNTALISLTNNPRLQKIYKNCGATTVSDKSYYERQLESPGITIFKL